MKKPAAEIEPLLLFVAVLLLGLVLSRWTVPSAGELTRLSQVASSKVLVLTFAGGDLRGLFSERALETYRSAGAHSALLCLLDAWSALSLGRLGLLDPLSAERISGLALGALGTSSVWTLAARAAGRTGAALTVVLFFCAPGWANALVTGAPGAAVICGSICAFHLYVKSVDLPGCWRWSIATAVALGFCLGLSRMSLVLAAGLWLHFLTLHRGQVGRSLAAGLVPVPAFALFALPLTPAVAWVTAPELWGQSVSGTLHWALASPQISPWYAMSVVGALVGVGVAKVLQRFLVQRLRAFL